MNTHPPGYINSVVLRVSAALNGAGAWDAAPVESSSAFAQVLTLAFTYTRGGAAGAFDWQLWVSPYSVAANVPAGAQEWESQSVYAGGLLVAGADTQSRVQREYQTYQATGAAVEAFAYMPIVLDGTIERIRVRARESGNLGAPGTLQITGVMK
ncbi:MAG: hypothetical protein GY832_26345 [Chloroflexi bacterium]|nr:hypothetical protein [Chloroflexota bacterium]